jgi:DNA-binding NtrC family response regulator
MQEHDYSILIVDDEEGIREGLGKTLSLEGYHVETAATGAEAIARFQQNSIDLGFLDLKLPDIDGVEIARTVSADNNGPVLVIMTAYATVETAVTAMKTGVSDYIKKPFDNEDILKIARRYFLQKRALSDVPTQRVEIESGRWIMLQDKASMEIRRTIEKIADSEIPVLILGESGTGKEVVASLIHLWGSRSKEPFIGINCSAIPAELMESELFGHEKGAFSGAIKAKPGKFEIAASGVLFLDEIGDMDVKLQAKLLRVLEERSFERIGGISTVPFKARVLASTNRDLGNFIDEGKFRSDLYFRLRGVSIEIPPIRARSEVVDTLVNHFLEVFRIQYGRKTLRISSEALKFLRSHSWPGNIRELKNTVESAVLLSECEEMLLPEHFRLDIREEPGILIRGIEKDSILKALEQNRFNRSLAAKELRISRKTLYNKMKKYDIE